MFKKLMRIFMDITTTIFQNYDLKNCNLLLKKSYILIEV